MTIFAVTEKGKTKGKKMKVDRVLPCVCLDHKLTCADSIYAGMPQLKFTPDGGWFEVYCPNCGRGGLFQYKSAYLALKHWNNMQERLWKDRRKETKKRRI